MYCVVEFKFAIRKRLRKLYHYGVWTIAHCISVSGTSLKQFFLKNAEKLMSNILIRVITTRQINATTNEKSYQMAQ